MKLYIKNMVCNRCIMVVRDVLNSINIEYKDIALGEVLLNKKLDSDERQKLQDALMPLGFEIIEDKSSRIIEQIKSIIIDIVQNQDGEMQTNLSHLLSNRLNHEYSYLSNLFSEVEGTTIEKYFIAQRIEKVKELLVYDELSLTEIAHKLNYSSVAYLSNQFKKVTGLTTGHFKKIKENKRKPIDEV